MWQFRYPNVAALVLFFVLSASGQNDWQNQQIGNNREDCCEEYCYTRDEEPYVYFGTKTAYDTLNRRSGSQHEIPGCNPIQFWSLIRHGTRLPNAQKIEELRGLSKLHAEILRNYEERRSYPDKGRLCIEDYNLITRWRWNDTIATDKADSLTRQGVEDLKLLARRYKSKYPQIFQGTYDEKTYNFQYESVDRTQETYQAYIEGLFGSEAYRVHANVLNDERLTKPDTSCKNLMNRQDQNVGYRNEYQSFLSNPEYQKTANDVFRRLGFRYNLNASVISDIYDLCRYEKAWNVQQRSPWCISFTKTQLKFLEYGEDLKHYYKSGYGNKMSEKIGCSPVKDFYERFEKTVNGDTSGNKATFFFTKASTLLNVLTAMGIGRDYAPLPADRNRRNWKTSELSPFGANLAAVLYQCRDNEYKVMFFLNEVPVELPECSVGLCSWSMVQQKYQGLVKNCNVNDICNENSAHSFYLNYILYVFSAAALLYLRM
ncbi:multiple inositol polyphosphate phosphatase 1-like [Anoplophora glabripennis]|uniref:multiple inositol polyphosphate phosphatase 1-like n=1 Tax=Anoplophora glabripennis TaxID=217634 RepID=UPI000874FC0C|nr:multiple inositol polyphosphate phosphatase 1-like [Anoplophora glabripennis]